MDWWVGGKKDVDRKKDRWMDGWMDGEIERWTDR
jgi:hypothetical protein